MDAKQIDEMLKPVLLKDLRIQCRVRGISPAGGKEQLSERLKEHMLATGDFNVKNEAGENIPLSALVGSLGGASAGTNVNNYARPEGQNVGNMMTDRPSSRVLAVPGGVSSIVLGDASNVPKPASPAAKAAPAPAPHTTSQIFGNDASHLNNNYARPGGAQNLGNYITGRNSSRVLAPPGGASQITFG